MYPRHMSEDAFLYLCLTSLITGRGFMTRLRVWGLNLLNFKHVSPQLNYILKPVLFICLDGFTK